MVHFQRERYRRSERGLIMTTVRRLYHLMLADFLDDVIDPLVASGRVQWATFTQMADAFEAWEADHPGVDPRS